MLCSFFVVPQLLSGKDWANHVRALADADRYSSAWDLIDNHFKDEPTNPKVKKRWKNLPWYFDRVAEHEEHYEADLKQY